MVCVAVLDEQDFSTHWTIYVDKRLPPIGQASPIEEFCREAFRQTHEQYASQYFLPDDGLPPYELLSRLAQLPYRLQERMEQLRVNAIQNAERRKLAAHIAPLIDAVFEAQKALMSVHWAYGANCDLDLIGDPRNRLAEAVQKLRCLWSGG